MKIDKELRHIDPDRECCYNCDRYSGSGGSWAKLTKGWCLKRRTAMKALDICGYFKRTTDSGRYEQIVTPSILTPNP